VALRHRLKRLEDSVKSIGGGVCPMCCGYPMAAVEVMHERDPHGPGFRPTGERYLAHEDEGRITDDLRCRQCGKEAFQVHLMSVVGIGPKPEGRRV
jgi:hypothetical protein